jgi:CBS domain-containing protein/ribosome-associated translation inhibitor RaiA
MRLQEIMTTDVVQIGPDESADAAWARMESEDIRHLVVMENGKLLGVVSQRDLGGAQGAQTRAGKSVRDLMAAQPAVAKPRTTLRQAANLMHGRLIGSLPVVDDGKLVGIVTATDVLEELGRGSSRPTVRAQRKSVRRQPAGQRTAARRDREKGKRQAESAAPPPKPRSGRGARRGAAASPAAAAAESKRAVGAAASRRAGPARARRADSPKRAPLAERVARVEKRVAGRTAPAETPAYIRAVGVDLSPEDKDYLRRKLGRKLGKFSPQIERVSVRIEDINGPRGGVDKRCRIKIVLSGLPSVVVEEQHESLQAAMDGALGRAERAVRQSTQRRRTRANA